MLGENEFIFGSEENVKRCTGIAIIADEEYSRSFILYDDGTRENGNIVVKFGELVKNGDSTLIEEIEDEEIIERLWKTYIELYTEANNKA